MQLRHLVLPVALFGALSVAASPSHTVVPGDTVSGIAQTYGVSQAALVSANGLADPDLIRIGQRLQVPAAPAAPAAGPAAPAVGPDAPTGSASRAEVGALIDRIASEQGWSPAFVKALAWQESGWSQDRVSHAGAIGIMQVMPGTGDFISRQLVGRELDLHDPSDNVLAGVVFLQHLWELTDGDVELTLAGYYQGLRSVRINGRYQDTDRYIANVLALRERFR